MGGECNYLLRCVWPSCRLEFVPEQVRFSSTMQLILLSETDANRRPEVP